MGLDAEVACNCFERGLLNTPPPVAVRVYDDGFLVPVEEGLDLPTLMKFDEWSLRDACEHPQQRLIHRRLGNLDAIVRIRSTVQGLVPPPPVLLEKVLYHFAHSGDWLTPPDVELLGPELDQLAAELDRLDCPPDDRELVRDFLSDMKALHAAATRVGKPIRF